ncbi:MAG: hypothetical protein ACLPND_08290 [Candidatus Korobacteraceae bacterium]
MLNQETSAGTSGTRWDISECGDWIRLVIERVKNSGEDAFLLNKLIEISGIGRF